MAQYGGAINRGDAGPDQETLDRASFDVRTLGYRDIYQAVSSCLQVHLDQSMNAGYSIFVSLPVYARIDAVSFDGSTFSSTISFHDRFNSARLVVHLLSGEGWGARSGPPKEEYEFCLKNIGVEKLGNSINRVTLSTKLQHWAIHDHIDARLLLGGLNLDEEGRELSGLLLKHPNRVFGVEFPLRLVLDRFCSVEDLSKQLLSPEKVSRPSRVFERAVSWLLSSSGVFCVVKLDEFEKLIIKESKFTKGSADLIAYAPQYSTIYVVSCTMDLPQDKEISSIKECAEYLSQELFDGNSGKVRAAMVTTKIDTSHAREECNKRSVQLVDGSELRSLMQMLSIGDAEGFRRFWQFY